MVELFIQTRVVFLIIDNILSDIQKLGFSVQENIFSSDDLLCLKNETLNAYHNNSLKEAGIGRGAEAHKNIRGDKIAWLKKENLSDIQKTAWDFLETLKVSFNRSLFFGLKDFETHMTVYPANSFYKKHIDQFKVTGQGIEALDSKHRKVSFIIYLNEDWNPEDGGELAIYDSQNNKIKEVVPKLGRAVFFLSEEFPHEVLETKKERVSMTGWFYQ